MYEGVGVGGPRNGIKLSAGPTWDGRIKKKGNENKNDNGAYHRGRYIWDADLQVWEWFPMR